MSTQVSPLYYFLSRAGTVHVNGTTGQDEGAAVSHRQAPRHAHGPWGVRGCVQWLTSSRDRCARATCRLKSDLSLPLLARAGTVTVNGTTGQDEGAAVSHRQGPRHSHGAWEVRGCVQWLTSSR